MNDSSKTPLSDLQHNLLSFASAATGRALHSIWHDGQSLYGTAREVVTRTARGVTYGLAGAGLGAVSGFLIKPVDRSHQSEKDRLLQTVQRAQMIREVVPMVTSMFSNIEYEARKKLEDMGYYPCETCGVPHVKDEPHHMPPGTYWYEAEQRYVRPDDPKWNQECYEAAAGDRWDLDDDEGGGGEQVH